MKTTFPNSVDPKVTTTTKGSIKKTDIIIDSQRQARFPVLAKSLDEDSLILFLIVLNFPYGRNHERTLKIHLQDISPLLVRDKNQEI